jgi:hypothetical protein
LIVLGAGFDWGQPYNCSQWSRKFDLTYPLLDDVRSDLFFTFAWDGNSSSPGNQYYVPMNIIYDHNMVIQYRAYGFSEIAIKKKINELIEEMPATSLKHDINPNLQPSVIKIFDPYPNPFNGLTKFSFSASEGFVGDVIVYNTMGEEVVRLAYSKDFEAGTHSFLWQAERIPSGLYIIRVETSQAFASTKVIFLK